MQISTCKKIHLRLNTPLLIFCLLICIGCNKTTTSIYHNDSRKIIVLRHWVDKNNILNITIVNTDDKDCYIKLPIFVKIKIREIDIVEPDKKGDIKWLESWPTRSNISETVLLRGNYFTDTDENIHRDDECYIIKQCFPLLMQNDILEVKIKPILNKGIDYFE